MSRRLLEFVCAGLLLSAVAAVAAPAANVSVTGAWFRALPSDLPAGGYFTLRNLGDRDMVLTGAHSAACGMLMLHQSTNANGTEQMADVERVDLAAHGTVNFAPGGYHLMCMAPTPAMKPGNKVPVALQFSDGSKVTASFDVKNARGE